MLVKLFQFIFDIGIVPTDWYKTIIHPIPKSLDSDPRIPLNYRGISLVSCMSKLFTGVLTNRLNDYFEENGIVVDEQGGFRKKRSCNDQAFILHSLASDAIQSKASLFGCFIDLKKAFDCVNREMLLYKLLDKGIEGKMYFIIKSLYNAEKTMASIKINDLLTDWFYTTQGVKQGDSLSPILFLLFINDLAKALIDSGLGVEVDGRRVPILLYADDIVLLSNSEKDLQTMVDVVHEWCSTWLMSVNLAKTKIVHFRHKRKNRSEFVFKYGEKIIDYVDTYKYLGIYFDQHLDFRLNEEELSKAGGRALGALVSKLKQSNCMGYEAFSKCVSCSIYPILDYGSEIVGYVNAPATERVENRAADFSGCS